MRISSSLTALLVILALVAAACGGPETEAESRDDGPAAVAGEPAEDDSGAVQEAGSQNGMEDGVVVRMDSESVDDYIARLAEAAAQEGTVAYYSSASDEEIQIIMTEFGKLHPDIQFEPVSASSGTILERALLEAESGNVRGDVYGGAAVDQVALENIGALADYRPANEEFVDADFLMDGPYSATGYLSYHPAYNTDLVSEDELPDEWMGYCDPEWDGRLAIDQEGAEWVAGLLRGMGEDEGLAFLECLAANNPRLVRGSTNRTELLAAGEFAVQLDGYGHRIKQFEEEGAPIAAQVPSPAPLPVVLDMSSIFQDAPHPNAAR